MSNYNLTLQSNNTDLQEVLTLLQTKAAGGEQATPEISVNSSGLITATASTKSSTYQLAFQAAKTITPTTASQIAVSSGYYTGGNVTVAGDANLVASNIKSGVSIFGVSGTHSGGSGGDTNVDDGIIDGTVTEYANDRVESIKDYTFNRCSKLTSVNFPACKTISNYAFAYCTSLTTASFPACTTIGSNAFRECSKLTTASFPVCTNISAYAFQSCFKLTTVSFPACTSIGSYAFYKCSKLTTASFPVCTNINNYAFQSCSSLTTVSFPICTSIGSYAFVSCSRLTTASFPACTTIGSSAFGYCYSLASASFPVCTNINNYAFGSCSSLTLASFPACTTIGSYAFGNCWNLKSLYLTGSSLCTLVNSRAFTSTPIGGYSASAGIYGSIYVPSSLLTSYQTATNWTYFSSRFVGV